MYNLIESSSNYSETKVSIYFYSKDEATNFNADIANKNFKSFEYKAKFLGNTVADGVNGIPKIRIIAVPLKYLSNIRRSLEMPLINCKVDLKLHGRSTVFCLQLVLIMIMLILIILFLL